MADDPKLPLSPLGQEMAAHGRELLADDDTPITITDPDKIRGFQLLVWHHAMRLEAVGLRHSSGRSVTAIVKKQFGLKGNRAKVQAAFEAILIERGILRPKVTVLASSPKEGA